MDCLFCKMSQGEIPVEALYEDQEILAFRDIKPQAPSHLLIIPKKHIATINDANMEDTALLGKMVLCAQKLAQTEQLDEKGYRLVYNVNPQGGQVIYHIHLHLLGGRQMTWPPG